MAELARRRFLTAAVGAAALATPARLRAANPLRVGCTANAGYAGAFYAHDAGFFERAGLDADVEPLASGAAVTAAVAARAMSVGITNVLPLATAVEHGIGLKYICAGELIDVDQFAFSVAADSPYRTGHDLDGKTIGVSSLNDIAVIAVKTWVDRTGGDSSTLHFVEIPFSQMAAAVRKGTIDAGPINEPWLSAAQKEGGLRTLLPPLYGVFAPGSMIGGWFAYADWIDAHRDTARRFRTAIYEADRWANAHPDDAAAILTKYTRVAPALIERFPRRLATSLEPEMLQSILNLAYHYKAIDRPIRAADVIADL